jgi:hypothetical protein
VGGKLNVLRYPAQNGVAVHYIVPANCRVSSKDGVIAQHGSGTDHDISLNDTVRSYLNVIRENGGRMHDCSGMDFGHWVAPFNSATLGLCRSANKFTKIFLRIHIAILKISALILFFRSIKFCPNLILKHYS